MELYITRKNRKQYGVSAKLLIFHNISFSLKEGRLLCYRRYNKFWKFCQYLLYPIYLLYYILLPFGLFCKFVWWEIIESAPIEESIGRWRYRRSQIKKSDTWCELHGISRRYKHLNVANIRKTLHTIDSQKGVLKKD